MEDKDNFVAGIGINIKGIVGAEYSVKIFDPEVTDMDKFIVR